MSELSLPATGGCRCGAVRFEVTAAPLLTMACHCRGCQRMTGSAYSLSAAIPSDGFRVTAGEPVIGGLHGATRHYFCGHCMSWLFTRPEGMDWFVNLRPTMLDEPGWFEPFGPARRGVALGDDARGLQLRGHAGDGGLRSGDAGLRGAARPVGALISLSGPGKDR